MTQSKKSFFSSSKNAPPRHLVDSHFNEGLPEELSKANLSNYTTKSKLVNDFMFREKKLHAVIEQEENAFKNGPDANDPEKARELKEKHQKALREFREKSLKTLEEYEIVIKEQESSRRKGLR